jgi:hypothetical protein
LDSRGDEAIINTTDVVVAGPSAVFEPDRGFPTPASQRWSRRSSREAARVAATLLPTFGAADAAATPYRRFFLANHPHAGERPMKMSRLLTLVLSLALIGCAAHQAEDGVQRPTRQPNFLSQEDVRNAHQNNLYDVVATLRPNWLIQRGQISFADPGAGQVIVYLNDVRAGGAEFLRQISVLDVVSLRYLNATEASARFGLQQSGGAAIIIRTTVGG